MTVHEHIVKTERGDRHEPQHQNGDKAIVLGAREGNIGGAIAETLCSKGWIAQEDDCLWPRFDINDPSEAMHYDAPPQAELTPFDACVITVGTTHMEPFSEVGPENFHGVLRGSLGLPLECARRYVQARLACGECSGGTMRPAGSLMVCNVCARNELKETRGNIIFIGSYAHNHPFTHCTSYCVAKAGLDMAARSLAWELMPEGFFVHIIHPHHVGGTPMTEQVRKGMMEGVHKMTEEEARAYQYKDLRMPALLETQEIAQMVVLMLEEPVMRWVSGTSTEMYGGVR